MANVRQLSLFLTGTALHGPRLFPQETRAMTMPPKSRAEIDIREEVDIVRVDPTFLERQRNRYASRGVALVVLLNGVAAIALLVGLTHGVPTAVKPFAD